MNIIKNVRDSNFYFVFSSFEMSVHSSIKFELINQLPFMSYSDLKMLEPVKVKKRKFILKPIPKRTINPISYDSSPYNRQFAIDNFCAHLRCEAESINSRMLENLYEQISFDKKIAYRNGFVLPFGDDYEFDLKDILDSSAKTSSSSPEQIAIVGTDQSTPPTIKSTTTDSKLRRDRIILFINYLQRMLTCFFVGIRGGRPVYEDNYRSKICLSTYMITAYIPLSISDTWFLPPPSRRLRSKKTENSLSDLQSNHTSSVTV